MNSWQHITLYYTGIPLRDWQCYDNEAINEMIQNAHSSVQSYLYINLSDKFEIKNEEYYRKLVVKEVLRQKRMAHHINEIARLFNQENIRYCVWKGLPLQRCLYGDKSYHRSSGDIDFLIHPDDILNAQRLLIPYDDATNQFLQYNEFYFRFGHHMPEMVYKKTRIDLHHRIAMDYMTHIGINYFVPEILSHCVHFDLDGNQIKTPHPVDHLLMMMVHLYRDQVYGCTYKVFTLVELLYYVRNISIDHADFKDKAKRYNCIDVVKYCVSLLKKVNAHLFGDRLDQLDQLDGNIFPIDDSCNLDQFRSHVLWTNMILGYFSMPIEDRYFMPEGELLRIAYGMIEEKKQDSMEYLFQNNVLKILDNYQINIPPTHGFN